jgi:hypothetical protein
VLIVHPFTLQQTYNTYLFSSNQLSRFALKSMWSPKFPGREDVVKY